MKKCHLFIISLFLLVAAIPIVRASEDLGGKLSGRILLQVEDSGEAWYINQGDQKRYFLGRPDNAFSIMERFGIGITNTDLNKIPIAVIAYDDADSDGDGLTNRFEDAIGTDKNRADSDADGYSDLIEIEGNYNPAGSGTLPTDLNFAKSQAGKILLQVEDNGEAWYVNPVDNKRYFLNRPSDALKIMRELGLGITDKDISRITIGTLSSPPPRDNTPSQIFSAAAAAIRSGNKSEAADYFVPEMEKAIDYTMDYLSPEQKLELGNILSGAKLTSSNETESVYSADVYFSLGGYSVPVNFYIKKQADGTWKLTNL